MRTVGFFISHWSGKENLKSFERWKAETPVTIILYFICNYILLGWNWKIIRIEALVLSTTIFQIYSLALPLSVFMKLHFLSFIWFLKSFVSAFLIWLQPSLEITFLFSHCCYYFYYAEENVRCSHPELPKNPLTEY